MTRPVMLAIIEPSLLEAANEICSGYVTFQKEVTQGLITATRAVDGYAAWDSNLWTDSEPFWRAVVAQELDPEQFPDADLEAFYAGITVTIYDPDADGNVPTYEEALAAAGYVETPPVPDAADIRQERTRRIREGGTFEITGYGPVSLNGKVETKVDLLALTLEAIQDPTATIVLAGADGTVHSLTAPQFMELQTKAAAWVKIQHAVANEWIANGAPTDWQTNDSYWTP